MLYASKRIFNDGVNAMASNAIAVKIVESLIIRALPDMFHYLDDPEIPYTTNRLENYFAHLKEKLTLHRGLRFESKKNFIKWYLHFKNNPML